MIDTSGIPLDDLIEREAPSTRLGKASGYGTKRTRKGPCPWCGGTDRFAVLVGDTPQRFYCGIHGGEGCHRHGDAIGFIMQWHGVSFPEAVKRLGLQLPERDANRSYAPAHKEKKVEVNTDVAPSDTWAMAALSFASTCQKILWSDTGKPARAFLKQRGFTDATIKERGYGYNPVERFVDIAEWDVHEGKMVWLPRGIVIPWMIAGTIWKISIRRGDADLKKEADAGQKPRKYVVVKGGSNAIYRADTIKSGQALVIFEGEFNADMLGQILAEAGVNDVSIVATGSTGKGRADNWLMKIARAKPILFSFDPDGGGDRALKEYWTQVLPHGVPWAATGGDLNDMYLAGKDVLKWLKRGLKIAGGDILVTPPPAPEPVTPPPAIHTEPIAATDRVYYHTLHEGPYDDTDGVKREYIVTYLSHHAEQDVCFSPYFEQILNEVAEFEADPDLLQFELWDTSTNILVARFRKWQVGGGPSTSTASFTMPSPIKEFTIPTHRVKDAAGKWARVDDWEALKRGMPALVPDADLPQCFKDSPCTRCHNVGQVARRSDGVLVCQCFWWWNCKPEQVELTAA